MSKDIRESLSALMDGEASELELRRLLREDSGEVSELWSRFHRQRSALHNEREFASMDVSAGVRAALADELPHRQSALGQWRRPLGGLAVAASVAIIVAVVAAVIAMIKLFQAASLNLPLSGPVNTSTYQRSENPSQIVIEGESLKL